MNKETTEVPSVELDSIVGADVLGDEAQDLAPVAETLLEEESSSQLPDVPQGSHAQGGDSARRADPHHGPIRSFFRRNRDELIGDALVGAMLAVLALIGAIVWDNELAMRQAALEARRFALQEELEEQRFTHQEVLENTRFVRQAAIDGAAVKPFEELNLRGAKLGGLDLSCKSEVGELSCARFDEADLTDASLYTADLTNAQLIGADLTNADLTGAVLTSAILFEAKLIGADCRGADFADAYLQRADLTDALLREADFTRADLTSANLRGARYLEEATLQDVCYSGATIWPENFPIPTTPMDACRD